MNESQWRGSQTLRTRSGSHNGHLKVTQALFTLSGYSIESIVTFLGCFSAKVVRFSKTSGDSIRWRPCNGTVGTSYPCVDPHVPLEHFRSVLQKPLEHRPTWVALRCTTCGTCTVLGMCCPYLGHYPISRGKLLCQLVTLSLPRETKNKNGDKGYGVRRDVESLRNRHGIIQGVQYPSFPTRGF